MPHQDKNKKSQNGHHLVLLPITGTLFLKKAPIKKEQNSLDFHLEIINKIDTLLEEHEHSVPSSNSSRAPPIIPLQPPSPIEPRLPLNKMLSHQEITWISQAETSMVRDIITPEEFKTELTINPEFRFITSKEFIDTLSQTRQSSEERIEIIDLSRLDGNTTTFHKNPNFTLIRDLDDKGAGSAMIHDVFHEEYRHKKIEIIDARRLKQVTNENTSNDTIKQAEQSEQDDKKSQVYYINNKEATDKKQKKLDIEQTFTPMTLNEKDLDDGLSDEDKTTKQLEREREQLRRENEKLKKAILEEKKHELREKDKKSLKKAMEQTGSKRDLKKQTKEQKRLQRLKIKQARIEKKRRKREEKLALKLKQKQQRLLEKEKKLQQPNTKQKTKKPNLTDKEEYTDSLVVDDDLRKVLLMTDTLLAELPEEILDQFIHSKEFELYEKVLNKYRIK